MKFREIVFATGNKGKAREAQDILGIPLKILDIELDEIQELDLEKVAFHKLNQAFEITKKPVIIDDISIEIDAWNKFPGPLIKWLLKSGDGPSLLLKLLENEKNRKATTRLAIGFHDGKKSYIFYGVVEGEIAQSPQGENGFGWDPIFIPQ